MQPWVHQVQCALRLVVAPMLRMRCEGVLEAPHVVAERFERCVHAACGDAADHTAGIHGLESTSKQVQRDVDVFVHHILLVEAHLVVNELPCRSAQCHVGAEQQHLTAIRTVGVAAHAVVAAQCDFVGGHVVIGDRAGGSHCLGILGEDASHHFHPIRLEHAVGIHTSENVAGGMVESVVSRRNETLLLILMEQLDQEVGCSAM